MPRKFDNCEIQNLPRNISSYNSNLQKIQNISKLDYSGLCDISQSISYKQNDICSQQTSNTKLIIW